MSEPSRRIAPRLLLVVLVYLHGPHRAGAEVEAPAVKEVRYSFRNDPEARLGWELLGPNAEECVRFEPSGLRITLPSGWDAERPSTGVRCKVPVGGDFEITMRFEILAEPQPGDAGPAGTRLSLGIFLATPKVNVVTLSRSVGMATGKRVVAWSSLWNPAQGKSVKQARSSPTSAQQGRLRLVRKGGELAHYLSEADEGPFTLVSKAPIGMEPLQEIRLAASTGGPRAALDVRISDLHIRADSLPEKAAAAPSIPSPPAEGGSRLVTLLVAGALITLLAGGLGLWLFVRRNRSFGGPTASMTVAERPGPGDPKGQTISCSCPGCGKNLDARPSLAGKKVRCPGCGQGFVLGPDRNPKEG